MRSQNQLEEFARRGRSAQAAVDDAIAKAKGGDSTTWLIQRTHGRTKVYLTKRGGWTTAADEAERFKDEAAAVAKLRGRPGTPVHFALG